MISEYFTCLTEVTCFVCKKQCLTRFRILELSGKLKYDIFYFSLFKITDLCQQGQLAVGNFQVFTCTKKNADLTIKKLVEIYKDIV